MTDRERWFLTVEERGNPGTDLDARRRDGRAWTEGNEVTPLIHGATYFRRLYEVLCSLKEGDWVNFTDWRGDPDERLIGPGTEVGKVLADIARNGVHVRGLMWRSHPSLIRLSEGEHVHLGHAVNEAGGEILLDERVRRGGSHHQKLFLLRRPGREEHDVAFAGGVDLCHGRNDDARHLGDPQPYEMDKRYGPRPPWHDVQLQIRGPAIGDLATTFRERWEDPTPLDHRTPWRAAVRRMSRQPRHPGPLPPMPEDPPPVGSHAVQVLRTYPAKRPPYPFAPRGERSVARAYEKALGRARSFIYLEDQYLWSEDVAGYLADALRNAPELRLIAVVPRYPEQDGAVSGPPERLGQQTALDRVLEAGGDRVAVYDLENERSTPVYVHSKVCVIDDVWAACGSDNLNRRSWTHDSELSCSILDDARDHRHPVDPGGSGDGARVLARELRLALWREHLGRTNDDGLVDARHGFHLWREAALALDAWHSGGRRGARPPGQARVHDPGRVAWWAEWWARPAYRMLVDPDGRPRDLRRSNSF